MRHPWLLFFAIVLAIPLIPFLILGELPGTEWIGTGAIISIFILGVLVLASDIVLPLPSSLIAVFLGAKLGFALGTISIFLGLMGGSLIGYAMGRFLGRPVLDKLTSHRTQEMYTAVERRFSYWALALSRSIPLLAEASVLAAGVARLGMRQTVLVLAVSNLGLAMLYSAFGSFGAVTHSSALLFIGGILVPAAGGLLLILIFGKSIFRRSSPESVYETQDT